MKGRAAMYGIPAMLLIVILTGCTAPAIDPTPTPTPTQVLDARFTISCDVTGGQDVTFTRLEEAWADPSYVRIEACDAAATGPEVELTPEEASAAAIAAGGVDDDLLGAFLVVLGSCVRIVPEEIAALPTAVLRGVAAFCPDAPHAALVEADLKSRGER